MRLPKQEITDLNTIRDFLSKNHYCFLSIQDRDCPYTVPLNYGFQLENDGTLALYFHTSTGGRLYDVIHRGDYRNGIRVSFGLAIMDGILSSIKGASEWDTAYRSLIGDGMLTKLESAQDKIEALDIFLQCYNYQMEPGQTQKYPESRLESVTIYKVAVTDYHMKKSKQDYIPSATHNF